MNDGSECGACVSPIHCSLNGCVGPYVEGKSAASGNLTVNRVGQHHTSTPNPEICDALQYGIIPYTWRILPDFDKVLIRIAAYVEQYNKEENNVL